MVTIQPDSELTWQMKVAIPVENYKFRGNDPSQAYSADEAWIRAQEDNDTPIDVARDELTALVGEAMVKRLIIYYEEFMEFNSNNIGHAGAYHTINLEGSTNDINRVKEKLIERDK